MHPQDTAFDSIPVAAVVVPDGRRPLRGVADLAASMAEVGMIHPITVRPDMVLIAGYYRLEAAKSLGWESIAASIVTVDDLRARLIEIDENLQRHEGTHLERGELLADRKRVYEALHPEARRGTAGAIASNTAQDKGDATANFAVASPLSFVRNTATQTGRSERAVRQDVQIADAIVPAVKDAILDAPIAENKVELIELARLSPESQAQVAPVLARGEAKTVVAAQSAVLREQRRHESETAGRYLRNAGAPSEDEIRDRLLTKYARLASSHRSGLLALDPELVADVLPAREHIRLRQLAADSAAWFGQALASLDRPLRIVGGTES